MPTKNSSDSNQPFGRRFSDAIPFLMLSVMLGAGFFFHRGHLPGFEICWFRRAFHLDCAGCGLTRAFLLIPKGQFYEALKYNIASILLYFFFFTVWLDQGVRLLRKQKHVSKFMRRYFKAMGTIVVMVIFAGWVYKLWLHFMP